MKNLINSPDDEQTALYWKSFVFAWLLWQNNE